MNQHKKIKAQLNQCIDLLQNVLGHQLLGVYLYGSAIVGGLQKFSDIDLFVISERATTDKEKQTLINNLLQISGVYMKSSELPIELTIVTKAEVNPWHYPAKFDFQYGDWLRVRFASGIIEPWSTKVMPDLALLITQIFLASETLFGKRPHQLLSPVPYHDFILATKAALEKMANDLQTDTRNVLLTYARIWSTLETNIICSKPTAALWAMERLPEKYQPVLQRARLICLGEINESWMDIEHLIQHCADFMISEIEKQFLLIESTDYTNKSISIERI